MASVEHRRTGAMPQDPHRPAVLTGACDLDRGGLAAWTVTDGRPDGAAISGLVASSGVPPSEVPMATAALREAGGPVDLATPPTRLRAGSALRAAIGGTVGRIRLLPQPAVVEGVAVPLVSPEDLRDVLREVLGSRDALDASAP